jgi:hypothetical protein
LTLTPVLKQEYILRIVSTTDARSSLSERAIRCRNTVSVSPEKSCRNITTRTINSLTQGDLMPASTQVLFLVSNTPVLALMQGDQREFQLLFGDKNVAENKKFVRGILIPRDIFAMVPKTGIDGTSWTDSNPPLLHGGVPVLVTDQNRGWTLNEDGVLYKLRLPIQGHKFPPFFPSSAPTAMQ